MTPIARHALIEASRALPDGCLKASYSVPDMHCGGCMTKIEKGLARQPGVLLSRANLSRRRVSITWDDQALERDPADLLLELGFENSVLLNTKQDPELQTRNPYLRQLAISGFAALNIMMMSVGVWSGAGDELRQVFHWLSAAMALLALWIAGPVFFMPAWRALKRGQTNMDVPISVGLVLTFAISVLQTLQHAEHAYFDAAASLLFFLLVGRTLEYLARSKIGSAVDDLRGLIGSQYLIETDPGKFEPRTTSQIEIGMRMKILPGERLPVNGVLTAGQSDLNTSIVNGEGQPVSSHVGMTLLAGTENLSAPIFVDARSTHQSSFIAEIAELIEQGEMERQRRPRLSDSVASYYTPFVHLAAALTFLAWWLWSGDGYHAALIAVSVLIITCPCALALAVPMVRVVAARRFLDAGILMRDGAALEHLPFVSHIFFDKTGTLTLEQPELVTPAAYSADIQSIVRQMTSGSAHPFSKSLNRAFQGRCAQEAHAFPSIEEIAGLGLEARAESGQVYRLGKRDWALVDADEQASSERSAWTVLSCDGVLVAQFEFEEHARADARLVVDRLQALGNEVSLISGDHPHRVDKLAKALGLKRAHGGLNPQDKLDMIEAAQARTHVMMVGDGLNDAAALSAASVSAAPAHAADLSRNRASFVFLRGRLNAIPHLIKIGRRANQLIRQNLSLAIIYNVIAVPLAMAGLVTPLVAAISMSASSLVVVLNAQRFRPVLGEV